LCTPNLKGSPVTSERWRHLRTSREADCLGIVTLPDARVIFTVLVTTIAIGSGPHGLSLPVLRGTCTHDTKDVHCFRLGLASQMPLHGITFGALASISACGCGELVVGPNSDCVGRTCS
jgi:hypothetical protein